MRILYLHRTQGQGVEGVHIRGMVDAMREAGHEVVIQGPPGTAPYGPSPEPVTRGLSARFARYARFVSRLVSADRGRNCAGIEPRIEPRNREPQLRNRVG